MKKMFYITILQGNAKSKQQNNSKSHTRDRHSSKKKKEKKKNIVDMDVGRKTLIHCWWEYQLVQPFWTFLKKLGIELLQPKEFSPRSIPKGLKALCRKDICTSVFIATLYTTTKIGNKPNAHKQITE